MNDLLDFYAGLAMHAFITYALNDTRPKELPFEHIAATALNMANAMLEQREIMVEIREDK